MTALFFTLNPIVSWSETKDFSQPPEDLPEWIRNAKSIPEAFPLSNVLPPLEDEDDPRSLHAEDGFEPVADIPFTEHFRRELNEEETATAQLLLADRKKQQSQVQPQGGEILWRADETGLYSKNQSDTEWTRHEKYGVEGPLSNSITALAADSRGALWVGTPLGLSIREPSGEWRHIQGDEGLPIEEVTALDIDDRDRLWIGTTHGAIHYRPYESGRQWFYRAGGRYLDGDRVETIAVADGGMPVYFETESGISCIDTLEHTLADKADRIENRLNRFHRRLGLVAQSILDDPWNPTIAYTLDSPNDGLWTSYHVTAMSLAYGATGKEEHRQSAKESMHAMYLLQNSTGIPGLPARSIVPAAVGEPRREASQKSRRMNNKEKWRPTPDGEFYWWTDTSNDEIDGHFLALYSYWRHIAQHDPEELELIRKQTRALMDYIIDHDYRLLDWDGEPTTWGHWNPQELNHDPEHYLENGLGSLQLLSFLKTSYAITGDPKYQEHYRKLIVDHGYLDNLLLEKKVFPDEQNHSDDQLGYVAWYPLLQLEWDPEIRTALRKAVRRHYKIIQPARGSFFCFASATIDPGYVDLADAAKNLRLIPTDRRMWRVVNSRRADIHFDPRSNRFGRPVLDSLLPEDERSWDRWNDDPYLPDGGGPGGASPAGTSDPDIEPPARIEYPDGAHEEDGGSWLLGYWMGRYHGFLADPE
ncbi:MAG: hypothetical protein H6751_13865 [Candidatus Omnitrophica bacterium]|nr:hypothetical protein [Candidatus Omnitrophota bacterium]